MKNFLLLLFTINCLAQAPDIAFQKSYGGTNNDFANKIIQTSDGGYLAVGATASGDGDVIGFYGYYDFWILKLNASGEIQWQQTLGGNGDEKAYGAVETADGSFIIVGQSTLNEGEVTGNHGNSDFWVVKLNAAGILQWQKSYGGSNIDIARGIVATVDGYVIAGFSNSTDGQVTGNHSGGDYWIIKIDPIGNLLWQKSYGGNGGDYPFYIQKTNDGGFCVVGTTNSNDGNVTGNHGGMDSWIVKLDSDGNLDWQKTLGGTSYDGLYTIEQTTDNGYILGGYTESQDGDVIGNDFTINSWFVKINPVGVIQWQKCLRNVGCDNAGYIRQTSDGGYIIGGAKATNNPFTDTLGGIGAEDVFLGRLDNSGNLLWTKILGSTEADFVQDVIQTNDGGYAIVGSLSDTDFEEPNYGLNLWIAKTNADQLSVPDHDSDKFVVYPNPVSKQININFSNEINITKINITDSTGKIILSQTGNINPINTESLATGTYFIQAFSGEKKYQSKFIKQ